MPDPSYDFWYAVNHTEVVLAPRQRLETFGATAVDYHLVCESMDDPSLVKVREGRLQAFRPEILTPQSFLETELEGFSDGQARAYVEWLRRNQGDLLILKYGFKLRKEASSEQQITDRLDAVLARVKEDLARQERPHAALLVGVDEPWEVCLVKLMVELVQQSGPHHARTLREDPQGHRHEIETAFRAASRDRSRLQPLADLLRQRRLFGEYEDRFFALVRSHG